MDRRRHEVVPERVHGHEGRELAGVAEVVREETAGQRRAGGRLAGEDVDLPAGDLLSQERKGQPGEVRAAADAPDDDVGKLTGVAHLCKRLLPDDGLMQKHVVEHAAERVRGVSASRSVLDRLGNRDPETPR